MLRADSAHMRLGLVPGWNRVRTAGWGLGPHPRSGLPLLLAVTGLQTCWVARMSGRECRPQRGQGSASTRPTHLLRPAEPACGAAARVCPALTCFPGSCCQGWVGPAWVSCQSRGDPGVRRSIFCHPRLSTHCPAPLRSLCPLGSSHQTLTWPSQPHRMALPPGGFRTPPRGPHPCLLLLWV